MNKYEQLELWRFMVGFAIIVFCLWLLPDDNVDDNDNDQGLQAQ